MQKCKCGSYAINHGSHGRDGSDGDLCDVCYWRVRVDRSKKEEREACAKVCRDRAKDAAGKLPTPQAYKDEAMLCAAAILARSAQGE